jgi:hypothetical protein
MGGPEDRWWVSKRVVARLAQMQRRLTDWTDSAALLQRLLRHVDGEQDFLFLKLKDFQNATQAGYGKLRIITGTGNRGACSRPSGPSICIIGMVLSRSLRESVGLKVFFARASGHSRVGLRWTRSKADSGCL